MAALLGEEEREGVLDVNAVGGYYHGTAGTALLISCSKNWLRLEVMLLDNGADVNKAYYHGHQTPLLFSWNHKNLELARLLLSRGAKDNDTAQSSQKIIQMATGEVHTQF